MSSWLLDISFSIFQALLPWSACLWRFAYLSEGSFWVFRACHIWEISLPPEQRACGASDPANNAIPGIPKPVMSKNDPSRGPVGCTLWGDMWGYVRLPMGQVHKYMLYIDKKIYIYILGSQNNLRACFYDRCCCMCSSSVCYI